MPVRIEMKAKPVAKGENAPSERVSSCCPSVAGEDLLHGGVEPNLRARLSGSRGDGAGQCAHAAPGEPEAAELAVELAP
jgi:hypothetical protein